MKTLKQRFSTWYNKSTGVYGPLWVDRFCGYAEALGNVEVQRRTLNFEVRVLLKVEFLMRGQDCFLCGLTPDY